MATSGSVATGINASGVIVGYYQSAGANHSFVRDANGTYHTLDDPFAVNGTFAYDVNASGPVVGFYYDAGNKTHGFIATPNGGGTYAFTTLDDPVATTGTTAYVPLKGLSECLKPRQHHPDGISLASPRRGPHWHGR